MLDEMNAVETGKPRSRRRRRRLAAAVSVAALVGASTVLAASSASAAGEGCGSYHSWIGCVGYNGTAYTFAIHNGYSVSESETFWIRVETTTYNWVGVTIGPGATDTFSVSRALIAGEVCGGVDSVTIACQDYA